MRAQAPAGGAGKLGPTRLRVQVRPLAAAARRGTVSLPELSSSLDCLPGTTQGKEMPPPYPAAETGLRPLAASLQRKPLRANISSDQAARGFPQALLRKGSRFSSSSLHIIRGKGTKLGLYPATLTFLNTRGGILVNSCLNMESLFSFVGVDYCKENVVFIISLLTCQDLTPLFILLSKLIFYNHLIPPQTHTHTPGHFAMSLERILSP